MNKLDLEKTTDLMHDWQDDTKAFFATLLNEMSTRMEEFSATAERLSEELEKMSEEDPYARWEEEDDNWI